MQMCLKITPLTTIVLHNGGGPLTRFEVILYSLAVGIAILVGACWDIVNKLVRRFHGRNWPTVSAFINVVTVTPLVERQILSSLNSHSTPYYLATLTYFYRNPDEQMGDYKRRFGNEDEAKAWANSYKGETVKVHVDPRDPTRSVLREEDL